MATARKAIRISGIGARHLPKMDTFGKCDPILNISFKGVEQSTKAVKSVFEADWDETFDFELSSELDGLGDLVVTLSDWERVGANKRIGEVRLSEGRMTSVCGEAAGFAAEEELPVLDNGKHIKGKDKEQCTIRFKLEILDRGVVKMSQAAAMASTKQLQSTKDLVVGDILAPVDLDESAEGERVIKVTVVSARSLPKMDAGFMGMGGKVDPFCDLDLGGVKFQTEVQKSTFSPDWDVTFPFSASASGAESPLYIKVFDWNQIGAPDLVGEVIISRERMSEMLKAKDSWTATDTFAIQKEGIRVKGHDKNQSVLTLKFMISIPLPAFSTLEIDADGSGPRKIEMCIVNARNLPKVDTFGTIDAFVEMIYEGEAQKTQVVKNSLEPNFDFVAEVMVEKVEAGCSQDVVFRLFDYNLTSAAELVGEARISGSRMSEVLRAKVGSEASETLVFMSKGVVVQGHNLAIAEVSLRVRVLEKPAIFDGIKPEEGARGARRLEMNVFKCEHLPSMDGMMGKCDGYAVLSFEECEYKTKTIKNSYTAEWDEMFSLDVDEIEEEIKSDISVTVWDWDRASEHDRVGSIRIPASRVCELFRCPLGSQAQHTFTLYEDGKPVIGHDKQKCEVTLKMILGKMPIPFSSVAAMEDVSGARRLEVTICSVNDLPKMDGLMGKCDPYAVLTWESGMEYGKTETKKNTYEAEWNETFFLDVEDAAQGTSDDFVVTLFDWDAMSADDEIGTVKVSAHRISQMVRGAIGSTGEHTFTVMADGKPVIGHSKSKCELQLKVRVSSVPLAFPSLLPQPESTGPRRLQVTLVKVSSCPKMDGLLGKCDPYAKLIFQEIEYKTKVVKNVYDAQWMDTFDLDVDDVSLGVQSGFVVSLWDYDTASQDDEIGSFKISASRVDELFKCALDSECEESFVVCDGGKAVQGHDKKRCEVTVKVKVCEVLLAFPAIEGAADAKGSKRIDLTVYSVQSLPNMDGMFGKCDPYALLNFEGIEFRTETKKGTYDATWDESYSLDLDDVTHGIRGDCVLTVMDWDATSNDDVVGSCKISATRMSEMFRAEVGSSGEHVFTLMDKGKPVVGHNKEECKVTLKVKVSEVPVAFPLILLESEASGPRRLEITLFSVEHLPKMDGIMGKCDPYGILSFGGVDYKTETKKNTYEAEWNETFNIDHDDVGNGTQSECRITVWDWDAASKDDEIGSVVIPSSRVTELFQGALGSAGEQTFSLKSEGKPVVGHDKQKCVVTLRIKVCEVPLSFPNIIPQESVSGPRRIVMTLVGCKSLPAMDGMFGKCDAYAVLSFENMEYKTDVVQNSYEAEWNEMIDLDCDDAATGTRTQCLVTLWDYDKVSKDDEIGSFKISAARMSEMFRGELDSVCSDTFTVMSGGHPVIGKDKSPCTVTVKVQVAEVPLAFPQISAQDDPEGPRRLELLVVSASHIPKADVGTGTCDPYLVLNFNGVDFTTETKRNTLTAQWDHSFDLNSVADKTKAVNTDLKVTLWDWDMMTKDDCLGSFVIKSSRIDQLFDAPLGSVDEQTFHLVQNGRHVIGQDGMKTEVLLRVKVCLNLMHEPVVDEEVKEEANIAVEEPIKKERKIRRVRKEKPIKEVEVAKSWWDDHPPVEETTSDQQGPVLGSTRGAPAGMLVEEPHQGMRVEEISVSRSGGGGGTVVSVTALQVRMQKSFQLPGGNIRQRRVAGDADDLEVAGRSRKTWAVCVEWDIGLTHIYHAKSDGTFNLRLLGGNRRLMSSCDGSLREGMVVELSQEGRDWYRTNSPTTVGLSGRGRILRTFETNSEVLWNTSGAAIRVPNRFLVQRHAKGIKRPKRVDAPTLSQTRQTSGSGGDVAFVRIECTTDGATIRYAMDKPSAPGLIAPGTSSIGLSGHAGWTVYQGPLHIPLEQRGQGSGHDILLKVCASKEDYTESKVVGWVVQRGHLARWEQQSPIWSTPHNVYQFNTPSKFRVWPPRPEPSSHGAGSANVFSETSYARARPVSASFRSKYTSGGVRGSFRKV